MRFLPTILLLFAASAVHAQADVPKASDPRLVVTPFAAAPDIVHPIACDFDAKGRLLVVESHTHFAPQGYKGPKFDRVLAFDVSKPGSKPTTFFEGTRHTMDIAVHPDGSVYVATRNEILRLRDTKGTGVANEKTRIVFLDTKGDYPHNGLSGLCFDSKGDLYFGMGENLGAAYKLIGSDGQSFAGQGDGGHIFHCSADGKKLRRVATGFWNPFGICRDIYGRVFAVDNDPDQAPPCRMLHVVEGGDYGFRFMYGRSGKHPFQSWHGQLPGTLPMMTGVGEAPCEILSYESDGLPAEYRGQLLVTSWADHRVERYKVVPHGASFKAERLPFVQGGKDFRPTGLCVAPDGSLFVADWVLSNYTLHGKGALWHVRWKDAPKVERPTEPAKAILSMHWPLREAAARKLASSTNGRTFLYTEFDEADLRVRTSALTALIDAAYPTMKIATYRSGGEMGMHEMILRDFASRPKEAFSLAVEFEPDARQREAIAFSTRFTNPRLLLGMGHRTDPFLRHAAFRRLATNAKQLKILEPGPLNDPKHRLQLLLALRAASRHDLAKLRVFLADADEDVAFLATKWVADEKLHEHRHDILQMLANSKLSVRMYLACTTALARLDGQEVSETKLADYFVKRLIDDASPPSLRTQLLRQVPATHKALTVDLLARLAKSDDAALKREAVRALVEHPSKQRQEPLLALMRSLKEPASLRGYAMLGVDAEAIKSELAGLAEDKKSLLRSDAQRALIGVKGVTSARSVEKDRPLAKDMDGWLKRLDGPADADVGERIFFHPKLGGCYKCHRIDGRGKDVGPDLSGIGRTDRRHLLESILQPSSTVAPHYQVWHLELVSGKTLTGMLVHTNLDEYTYLDAKGGQFKLRTGEIAETRAVPISIMPDGLVDAMTDQELRDLLAYLQTRK